MDGWTVKQIKSSIFIQKKMNEYVDIELLNGFIEDKMGIVLDEKPELEQINEYRKRYNKLNKSIIVSYKLPNHKWGRILPNHHLSLSVMHRPTRHAFCDEYIDFDMVNCQTCIIVELCKKNGINKKTLIKYSENTNEFRRQVMDKYSVNKDIAKKLFISILNGGSYNNWIKNNNLQEDYFAEIQDLQNEMKDIIEMVYLANQHIKKDVLKFDKDKWVNEYESKCGVMALWYQTIERLVQETAISSLNIKIEDIVPCQDGFMILKNKFNPDIIGNIEKHVFDTLGLSLKWIVKPFDEAITIRRIKCHKDMVLEAKIAEKEKRLDENYKLDKKNKELFMMESEKLEKHHCLIKDKSVYIYNYNNENEIRSEAQLRASYKHIQVGITNMGFPIGFIDKWITCNNDIRCYQHIGIYPKICPHDTYNLWSPFAMELVTKWIDTNIEFILNHIKILCNNEQEVYEYFLKWIGQMIQYPERKSICPVLISKEGAGKGTLMKILRMVLGNKKVFETSEPTRDVWGQFNGRMSDAFLVNLNELSKRDIIDSYQKFKHLVTDDVISINNKGVNQIEVISYHRFIVTTNSEDPVPTSGTDRRTDIIRSSDELIGNKQYFNDINAKITIDECKYFFEYLKKIPDLDKFDNLVMPITEYHKELQEQNVSPIERWVDDLIMSRIGLDETDIYKTTSECYEDFKKWCLVNFPKYEISSIQKFSCMLNNMKINGISKYRITAERGFKFNFLTLKQRID